MLTIAPLPRSTITGTAARVARRVVKKFICRDHSKSSSLTRETRRGGVHGADVVDEHVDRPVFVYGSLDERGWSGRVGQVQRHGGDTDQVAEAVGG